MTEGAPASSPSESFGGITKKGGGSTDGAAALFTSSAAAAEEEEGASAADAWMVGTGVVLLVRTACRRTATAAASVGPWSSFLLPLFREPFLKLLKY